MKNSIKIFFLFLINSFNKKNKKELNPINNIKEFKYKFILIKKLTKYERIVKKNIP